MNIYATFAFKSEFFSKILSDLLPPAILKLWEQTSRANSYEVVREEFIFERKKFMELRILCKHLVADELNGKFTMGENSANVVGITLPRFYEQHDLSQFSFRITAVGKGSDAAVKVLEMDNFDKESVHLLWTVTSEFTAIPEKFTLILTGVNSDNSVTVKFKSCPISVNSDETWKFLPSPELSEQLLNQTHREVQKAIDAANRAEIASQTPAPAEIYPATTTRLGGVKVDGKTITAGADGTISAADSETLKTEITDIRSSQKSISSLAVQIAHPNNYLIYDDAGKPSVMVAIPKFYLDEVIDGASHTVHPAFIINGVEQDVIYISKYQNIVENNRAYSLPMKDPKVKINFDQAWNYCKNKGEGWHLMTNAEWAAIALWCRKNGTMPNGNNSFGKDVSENLLPQNASATSYENDGRVARTATGSGRESWYHNGTFAGIADLNGNIYEWTSGVRLNEGELQIIENNDAADWKNSCAADSTLWKAIMPDGSLLVPGTPGTLKWDYTVSNPSSNSNQFQLNNVIEHKQTSEAPYGSNSFNLLTVKSNVNVPCIVKALALFPVKSDGTNNDRFYFRNIGERFPLRGGHWSSGEYAGIFSLRMHDPRIDSNINIGFRSAFYGDIQ